MLVNEKPHWSWLNWVEMPKGNPRSDVDSKIGSLCETLEKLEDTGATRKEITDVLEEATDTHESIAWAMDGVTAALDQAHDNVSILTEILRSILQSNNAITVACSDVMERYELVDWCKENFKYGWHHYEIALTVILIIENDEDRVLFKLRW